MTKPVPRWVKPGIASTIMGVCERTAKRRAARIGALEKRGSRWYIDLWTVYRNGNMPPEGSWLPPELSACRIKLIELEAAVKRLSEWVSEVEKRVKKLDKPDKTRPILYEKGKTP